MPKAEHASRGFYDVWLPDLAPSEVLVKQVLQASDEQAWRAFTKRYRAEMKRPEPTRLLLLLSALSRQTNLSVGCYCADETRCHRSVLKTLLTEHGALLARTGGDRWFAAAPPNRGDFEAFPGLQLIDPRDPVAS